MKLLRMTICWLMKGPEGLNLSWKSQTETPNGSEVTELPTKNPDSSSLFDTKQGWTTFSLHVELLMQWNITNEWCRLEMDDHDVLGEDSTSESTQTHAHIYTHSALSVDYLAAYINSCWTAGGALQVDWNAAGQHGDNSGTQLMSCYISTKYAYVKTKPSRVFTYGYTHTHTCALI